MSSSGSSVSSQSSDHPAAALAHLRSSILGRMSSEPGTSSSGNAAQGASTHVRRNRASSGNGSATRVPTFTPNLSDGRSLEQPTWSEFLREGPTTLRGADLSSDTHRRTQIALDRKRSFTASAQDSGRRRTVSGGFHNRHTGGHSPQLDGPSSPHRAVWPRRTESIDQSQENYFDLTTSPPAPHPRPSPFSSVRPGLLNARQYVLPKWQPDSDASKCPICKRQFGVFFRRHHCRKCGRVVCNDCSPHRITIPRQFIVHPPDQSQIPSRPSQVPIETIDLTEDGDRGGSSSIFTTETSISNPALGGGEKVRLCNPCVPDPQPSPHPDDSLTRSSATSSTGWTAGADGLMPSRNGNSFALPTSADLYHETLSDQASEMRRQRRRGMIVSTVAVFLHSCANLCIQIQQENDDLDALLTGPESATPERAPPHGIFNHTVRDNISRRDRPPSYQSYNNTVMSPPGYHVSTSSLTSNRPGDVQSGSVGSASVGYNTLCLSYFVLKDRYRTFCLPTYDDLQEHLCPCTVILGINPLTRHQDPRHPQ